MGETDISLGTEEDQGNARDQTSQPERLKDASRARAALPRGIIHSKLNPYVLCRVLSQRTRQLATRYPGKPFSQVIHLTMEEYREGKLQYVVLQSPQLAGTATRSERKQIAVRKEEGDFRTLIGVNSHHT